MRNRRRERQLQDLRRLEEKSKGPRSVRAELWTFLRKEHLITLRGFFVLALAMNETHVSWRNRLITTANYCGWKQKDMGRVIDQLVKDELFEPAGMGIGDAPRERRQPVYRLTPEVRRRILPLQIA